MSMAAPDFAVDVAGLNVPATTEKQHADQFQLHRGELQAYISAHCSLKSYPPHFVSVSTAVYRRLARVAGSFRLTCYGVPIVAEPARQH